MASLIEQHTAETTVFFLLMELFTAKHLPGSRAEFRCEVSSGLGEVTYLWTFNNTDISQLDQFTNRTTILGFGSQLVITDLRLEDSGQIGCEATNNLSVSRHLAELSVTGAGEERKVALGEKTLLACPLSGDSKVLISWLRDNTLVSRHPVLADGSLLIKAVAPSDLGEYLCQAAHLRLGEQGRARELLISQYPYFLIPLVSLPSSPSLDALHFSDNRKEKSERIILTF